MKKIYQKGELILKAKNLFAEERKIDRLDGWFIAKEIEMNSACKYNDCSDEVKKAMLLCDVLREIPISLSDNAVFVGAQRDAFAMSYGLKSYMICISQWV